MTTLNGKQIRFVEEYIVDLNATQAAVRAGYSEKTAYSQGQRLLKNVEVQTAITQANEKRSERTQITADQVVHELARVGLGDVRKLFTADGQLRPPHELDQDTAAMVASIEFSGAEGSETVKKVRLWDKTSALDKLMKHLGAYAPDKHDHMNSDGSLGRRSLHELTDEQLAAIAAGALPESK